MEPVDRVPIKKKIDQFVDDAIKFALPSEFNQAIMDFGATVCVPGNPSCQNCPFYTYCVAGQNETAREIPVKSKKNERKTRYFHYFEISDIQGKTIIQQRIEKDIWKTLYQFPVIETNSDLCPDILDIKTMFTEATGKEPSPHFDPEKIVVLKQILTHRNIVGTFYRIKSIELPKEINNQYCLVDRQKVSNFAFPKIMISYFAEFCKIH